MKRMNMVDFGSHGEYPVKVSLPKECEMDIVGLFLNNGGCNDCDAAIGLMGVAAAKGEPIGSLNCVFPEEGINPELIAISSDGRRLRRSPTVSCQIVKRLRSDLRV